jgi:hypothetical protein
MATGRRARTGGQLSKLSDKLAALAGAKCIASYIRDEHGDVFMILMADGCPACVEAKRQLQVRRQQPRPALFRQRCPPPQTKACPRPREELIDPELHPLVNMSVKREIEEIAQRKRSPPGLPDCQTRPATSRPSVFLLQSHVGAS